MTCRLPRPAKLSCTRSWRFYLFARLNVPVSSSKGRLELLFVVLTLAAVGTPFAYAGPQPRLCAASQEAALRPVWQGEAGWLFGPPDLITDLELPATALPYLERLAAALRAKGILPVALIVPTRGSVAYAHMGTNPAMAGYDPAAAAQGYRSFLAQLRAAGFIAPDLLTVARHEGDAFFFKRDHHWRPVAAKAVARKVAATLSAQLEPLPKTLFVTSRRPPQTQLGTLQKEARARCPDFKRPRERVAQFGTRPQNTGKGVGAALFTPVVPAIVLVGTSNSQRGENRPDFNFAGFLRQFLGLEVLDVAFPGAGVYGSLGAYLRSSEYRTAPPKILLWETLYMSWQRRASLPAEQRQILPSVYGACSRPLVERRLKKLYEGRSALLSELELPENGYLRLKLSDRSVVKFGLELHYASYQARVAVNRTTRVPNSGEFFLDLSSPTETPLQAVVIDLPKAVSGGAQVGICPLPPATK